MGYVRKSHGQWYDISPNHLKIMMEDNSRQYIGTGGTALLVLPEERGALAGEYRSSLEKAGWRVLTTASGAWESLVENADLTLIDFEIASSNLTAAEKIPTRNLVVDFHYRREYEKDQTGRPFHLLDHATIIIHDQDAERLLKEKIHPIASCFIHHPYAPGGVSVKVVDGPKKIFVPAEFSGHPWLAGVDVTFMKEPFPLTASAGSIIAAPEYSPGVWPLLYWGAGGGLGSVLPASPTFQRMFYYGALLFDPESEEDFRAKLSVITRPDPATVPVGRKMRVGVIVPRYGKNAPGGAETHAEGLARAFKASGHDAEIITTRTDSMLRWNNNLPEETEDDGGLAVRRFTVDETDQSRFHEIGHKINKKDSVTWSEETEWLLRSIRSRKMEDYLRENAALYDYFIFIPYLYGTTYWGVHAAPEKSYLAPCYHREAPAFIRTMRQNGMMAAGILFNTLAERKMAEAELGIRNPNSRVVGEGVDTEAKGDPSRFRAKYGVSGDFLLYVGRLQREKNVPQLLDYFHAYARNGGKTGLALAGMGDVKVKSDPSIGLALLGFVPEQDKIDAYSACMAFVLPSTMESFSIVMMEAWLQGKPVIANAACNVAREHIFTCGGGMLYSNESEFSNAVRLMAENPDKSAEMGRKGREYVLSNFKWDAVMKRIEKTLTGTSPRPLWARLGDEARSSVAHASEEAKKAKDSFPGAIEEAVMARVGADLMSTGEALARFEERAEIKTEYREFSDRSYIGGVISKARGAITNHLRKNYIEIFESKQSAFNRETVSILNRIYDEIRKRGK